MPFFSMSELFVIVVIISATIFMLQALFTFSRKVIIAFVSFDMVFVVILLVRFLWRFVTTVFRGQ